MFPSSSALLPHLQVELPKRDGDGAQPMESEADGDKTAGKDDDATASLDYRCHGIKCCRQPLTRMPQCSLMPCPLPAF